MMAASIAAGKTIAAVAEAARSGDTGPQRRSTMPYASNADLPDSVRLHLPAHAQDIFREAFNHAYAAHAGDPRLEKIAHRIAWAAVKRTYEKVGRAWVLKDN
jgi:cation transport regulator